jgi:AcrR family transcriptional regulator
MRQVMRPRRLSGQDRRSSILAAAREVFALHGFEGAKTQQIAAAAGVSEALVYRHFPSKTALYRAVLRTLITDQNASFAAFGSVEPSAEGLVAMLERTYQTALLGPDAPNAHGMRILVGSLAGDASYARLLYRRAHRLIIRQLEAALSAARRTGQLTGPPMAASNVMALIEHVTTMLVATRLSGKPVAVYEGGDEPVLRDVILFCGRGIGLRSDFIEAQLDRREAA